MINIQCNSAFLSVHRRLRFDFSGGPKESGTAWLNPGASFDAADRFPLFALVTSGGHGDLKGREIRSNPLLPPESLVSSQIQRH
jgi:hypothetical protein